MNKRTPRGGGGESSGHSSLGACLFTRSARIDCHPSCCHSRRNSPRQHTKSTILFFFLLSFFSPFSFDSALHGHCTILILYYIRVYITPLPNHQIRLCVYTVCNFLFHCSGSSQQVEHIHLPPKKKVPGGFLQLTQAIQKWIGKKKKDAHHVGWSIGFAAEAICNSCVPVFAHVNLYTVYTCLGAFWTSSATQI
jgi:hypothetical protein